MGIVTSRIKRVRRLTRERSMRAYEIQVADNGGVRTDDSVRCAKGRDGNGVQGPSCT